ncbi:MAG: hypothetical protein H5T92_05990 [Synergistales bacterium]|nr:hypothetical protein [Synergistales bacterium]
MKTRLIRVSIVPCLVGMVLLVAGCVPGEQAYVRIEDDSLVRFAGDGQRYLELVAVHRTQEFDEPTLREILTASAGVRRHLIMPTSKDIAENWGKYTSERFKSMVVLDVSVKQTAYGFQTIGQIGYKPLPGFELYIVNQKANWVTPQYEIVIPGGTIVPNP